MAELLKRHGLTLRQAYCVLNALVANRPASVTLRGVAAATALHFARLNVHAQVQPAGD